ncbi:MAG TPA: phosphatase PAP2 family protein [Chthoniobacterales bacterium]|nr:phosphatase PAP2 family protein [Chthoniobacterales bacterium]
MSSLLSFDFVITDRISVVDHEIAAWFHGHLTRPLIDLMLALSNAGSPVWIAAFTSVAILILVLRKRWYGLLAILLTVPGGMLIHHFIQIIVHRHRPFRHSDFLDLGGYSFPSGHTMAATLLYGLLAAFAILVWKGWHWRILAALGALSAIALVGFSRVVLGAHYLSDVLGAIASGIGWLILCVTIVERARRRRLAAETKAAVGAFEARGSRPIER